MEKWYNHPRDRLPYLGSPSKNNALLTTASNDDYWEYGTIISNTISNALRKHGNMEPAPWIYPVMKSPGHIWYWINENDCTPDKQKGIDLPELILQLRTV